MAQVRDQWTQLVRGADGKPILDKDERMREPNKRWPRNKRGEPIARPKGKRWLAVWIGPDGKEHTAAFELKDAAQKHAQAMETDQLRGVYFDSRKGEMKLTEYARDKWLPAQLHLRPNSVETYTYHLEKHIIPAFGTWRLAMIGREDVQKFVIALTKKPATAKKDGRKLAATTIETIFSVLRMLMQSAVDSGMIGANPCTRVRLPAKSERIIEPLPAEAVIALAKAITPRYRLLVLLAAMAGLREGEAFGLTVGKVEFLRRRIHVHQQAQSGALAPLKTDKSMRTIPADDMLIAEITRHMQRWPKGPDGTIVTNRLGRTVKRSSFSSCWSEAVEKAGLPKGTRFHDLRHFYASALIKANLNPKVIQSRLGHASIAETMDTYTSSLMMLSSAGERWRPS